MRAYTPDNTIKIEHTPVINKFAFPVNQVGAAGLIDIAVATFTYTSNSIFISDTSGNDSTGAGTAASPYKTIKKGINSTTASCPYVIILDSATYYESDLNTCDFTYFAGLYAATGQTPHRSCRVLDYTPSDSNTIYVSKSGSDSTGTGTAASPVLTIAHAITHCDATHQTIMIADDGTYTEDGFTFSGNFLNLYAAAGKCPTVALTRNDSYLSYDVGISATEFHADGTSHVKSIPLSGDRVLVAYVDAGDSNYCKYIIMNSSYSITKSETTIASVNTTSVSAVELNNGNILFLWVNASNGDLYYKIVNGTTFADEVSATVLVSGTLWFVSCCLDGNGNVFVVYNDSSGTGYYAVYSEDDMSLQTGSTAFQSTYVKYGLDVACRGDGSFLIIYMGGASSPYTLYYQVLNSSYATIKTITSLSSTVVAYRESLVLLNNDDAVVFYSNTADSSNLYFQVIGDNNDVLIGATYAMLASDLAGNYISSCLFQNKCFLVAGYSIGWGRYTSGIMSVYHIGASAAAKINGIVIQASENPFLSKLISASAAVQLSYCTIEDAVSDNTEQICKSIYSNSDVKLNNCIVRDNDAGIYTQENTSTIQDCQFYRNSRGYAIDIDGAAASAGDITVEHCDLFSNYGAIHLENNNGANETLKNLIIYGNGNGIDAETAVTYSDSVITDPCINATAGTGVVATNPLYVNEGNADPDDTDLNIKTTVLGYYSTSPAYDRADDDRNAGALDVRYVGAATSWTSITLDKPDIIDIDYPPVSMVNKKDDGSVSSKKKGRTEVVKLKWSAITVADWAKLDTMLDSDESTVRLYPNPTTNPDDYDTYTIEYASFSGSPKYWRLSDRGKQEVEIILSRKYEAA